MGFHDIHDFNGMHKKCVCHGNLHDSLLRSVYESHRSDSYSSFFFLIDIRETFMSELCCQILCFLWKIYDIKRQVIFYKIFISITWVLLANEYFVCFIHSVCGIIPGLSSVFLPRMNPFVLIDLAGAFALCITYMLIEIK